MKRENFHKKRYIETCNIAIERKILIREGKEHPNRGIIPLEWKDILRERGSLKTETIPLKKQVRFKAGKPLHYRLVDTLKTM